jgi:hypothetical protein
MSENKAVDIGSLRNARLNMLLRQPMLSQKRFVKAEEVVGSRRDASPTLKVIANLLGQMTNIFRWLVF